MESVPTSLPLAERLQSALQGVVDDPAGDHSLEAMAARVGVSVRHLSRLCTEHVGTTPARYVEAVRVSAAGELLRCSRAPLAVVASKAGFGSTETMRRAFLRTADVTPGAYRDRCRRVDAQ
jgi:transcriptional regulator GlxA family with amidase domain